MEESGASGMDTICNWSHRGHVTISRTQTCVYHARICEPPIPGIILNVDNKLQSLLTLSSLLAPVVQLNSACHHATTGQEER